MSLFLRVGHTDAESSCYTTWEPQQQHTHFPTRISFRVSRSHDHTSSTRGETCTAWVPIFWLDSPNSCLDLAFKCSGEMMLVWSWWLFDFGGIFPMMTMFKCSQYLGSGFRNIWDQLFTRMGGQRVIPVYWITVINWNIPIKTMTHGQRQMQIEIISASYFLLSIENIIQCLCLSPH